MKIFTLQSLELKTVVPHVRQEFKIPPQRTVMKPFLIIFNTSTYSLNPLLKDFFRCDNTTILISTKNYVS